MEDDLQLDIGAISDSLGGELGFDIGGTGDDNSLGTTGLGDSGAGDGADPVGGTKAGAQGTDVGGQQADTPQPGVTPPAGEQVPEPPKTWRKEAAAAWAQVPAEARAEILKREEDMFKGLEAYKADATFGKSLKGAMAPYLPMLQQYNIDPVQQVQALMTAHYTLATGNPAQKTAFFQQLARDYGVDLGQLAAPGEAPYVDPAVKALQTELQGVKSQLSAAEQARQLEVRQGLEKQIEAFAVDPANAHFNEVANDMAVLLEKGVCETLQEAYDRAVWSNPAVRAKELSRQQADAAKKAADEAAAKAEAARKSTAANVRTSAKSGSAAAPLGSMDDTLAETLAAIKARG